MREVINIDHKWAFQKAIDKVPDTIPKEWYMVNLPHTWNAMDRMAERTIFGEAAVI